MDSLNRYYTVLIWKILTNQCFWCESNEWLKACHHLVLLAQHRWNRKATNSEEQLTNICPRPQTWNLFLLFHSALCLTPRKGKCSLNPKKKKNGKTYFNLWLLPTACPTVECIVEWMEETAWCLITVRWGGHYIDWTGVSLLGERTHNEWRSNGERTILLWYCCLVKQEEEDLFWEMLPK